MKTYTTQVLILQRITHFWSVQIALKRCLQLSQVEMCMQKLILRHRSLICRQPGICSRRDDHQLYLSHPRLSPALKCCLKNSYYSRLTNIGQTNMKHAIKKGLREMLPFQSLFIFHHKMNKNDKVAWFTEHLWKAWLWSNASEDEANACTQNRRALICFAGERERLKIEVYELVKTLTGECGAAWNLPQIISSHLLTCRRITPESLKP